MIDTYGVYYRIAFKMENNARVFMLFGAKSPTEYAHVFKESFL